MRVSRDDDLCTSAAVLACRSTGVLLCLQLSAVDGVEIYGPPPSAGRAALCSFNVKGLHASDVSTVLDQSGKYVIRKRLPKISVACLLACVAVTRGAAARAVQQPAS